MNKMSLHPEGDLYLRSLKACLNWMAIGGEIVIPSGHTLLMVEDGGVGFKVTRYKGSLEEEGQTMIFQIDSDVSWNFLIEHARSMSEEDTLVMGANCALNDRT